MIAKLRRPKIRFLLSLVLLFSFIVIGFHHHEDGDRHSDCPICMAGGVYACGGLQAEGPLTVKHVVSYLCIFPEIITIQHPIFPTFAYRAPPFSIPS